MRALLNLAISALMVSTMLAPLASEASQIPEAPASPPPEPAPAITEEAANTDDNGRHEPAALLASAPIVTVLSPSPSPMPVDEAAPTSDATADAVDAADPTGASEEAGAPVTAAVEDAAATVTDAEPASQPSSANAAADPCEAANELLDASGLKGPSGLPESCPPPDVGDPCELLQALAGAQSASADTCVPPLPCDPQQDSADATDLCDPVGTLCSLVDTDGSGDCLPPIPCGGQTFGGSEASEADPCDPLGTVCSVTDTDGSGDCVPPPPCGGQTLSGSETSEADPCDPLGTVCSVTDTDGSGDCLPPTDDVTECLPPVAASSPYVPLPPSSQKNSLANVAGFTEWLRSLILADLQAGAVVGYIEGAGVATDPVLATLQQQSAAGTLLVEGETVQQFVDRIAEAALGPGMTGADLSTRDLSLLALSAPPVAGRFAFHHEGYGAPWLGLVQERYLALGTQLHESYLATDKNEKGWPRDTWLRETMPLRDDRILSGIATFYLGADEANARGNLYDSLPELLHIAITLLGDAAAKQGVTATNSSPICDTLNQVLAIAQGLVDALLDLIETLPQELAEQAAFVGNLFLGVWFDTVTPQGAALEGLMAPAEATTVAVLLSVMRNEDPVTAVYHGALLLGLDLVGTVARTLPKGGARTDAGEAGRWSIDIFGVEFAETEFAWHVPLPGGNAIDMQDGFLASTGMSPTVFEESGTIWQATSYDYQLVRREFKEPETIQPPPNWSKSRCTGEQWLWFAGTVAGAVGAGITAAANPVAGAAATVVVISASISRQNAIKDNCTAPPPIEDPGFYIEVGTFTNSWGDGAWYGEGISLAGGLVDIYGTAFLKAVAAVIEPHGYSNEKESVGYYHGIETAERERSNAEEVAKSKLPMFRPVKAIGTDAFITIEILCQAYGQLFFVEGEGEGKSVAPIDSASTICIRALVGGSPIGGIEGSGYGTIGIVARTAGQGGYVEVNGNRNPAPGILELEGEGQNIQGNP